MYLEVVTPDKKVYEGDITGVKVPGIDGSFEMLNNHAAIISALSKGTLRISTKDSNKELTIDGGIVKMQENKAIVLAEKVIEK